MVLNSSSQLPDYVFEGAPRPPPPPPRSKATKRKTEKVCDPCLLPSLFLSVHHHKTAAPKDADRDLCMLCVAL